MLVIDTNALVVLLVGLVSPQQVGIHKRTTLFSKEDFDRLIHVINDFSQLIILPNVWTEVDNILNESFKYEYKQKYIQNFRYITLNSTEKYLSTISITDKHEFSVLGVTDTLLLTLASETKNRLITSDSALSDHALSQGIEVYDMKAEANRRLRI